MNAVISKNWRLIGADPVALRKANDYMRDGPFDVSIPLTVNNKQYMITFQKPKSDECEETVLGDVGTLLAIKRYPNGKTFLICSKKIVKI